MERYAARFGTGNTVAFRSFFAGKRPSTGSLPTALAAPCYAKGEQIWVKARGQEVI